MGAAARTTVSISCDYTFGCHESEDVTFWWAGDPEYQRSAAVTMLLEIHGWKRAEAVGDFYHPPALLCRYHAELMAAKKDDPAG